MINPINYWYQKYLQEKKRADNLQSAIEVAEDHAYLAGQEAMKNKAVKWLEKEMADAGYTFDFEKKKLKKIEDEIEDDKVVIKKGEKSAAWCDEDEHRVEDTIYFLDTAKKHYASTIELDACIDWLKSLKDRIGG